VTGAGALPELVIALAAMTAAKAEKTRRTGRRCNPSRSPSRRLRPPQIRAASQSPRPPSMGASRRIGARQCLDRRPQLIDAPTGEIGWNLFDRSAGKLIPTADAIALFREVQRRYHGARFASGGRMDNNLNHPVYDRGNPNDRQRDRRVSIWNAPHGRRRRRCRLLWRRAPQYAGASQEGATPKPGAVAAHVAPSERWRSRWDYEFESPLLQR
jgi:hypothetical protein